MLRVGKAFSANQAFHILFVCQPTSAHICSGALPKMSGTTLQYKQPIVKALQSPGSQEKGASACSTSAFSSKKMLPELGLGGQQAVHVSSYS